MEFWTKLAFLGLFLSTSFAPVFAQGRPNAPPEFTDSNLGFRYTPPPKMRDLTAIDRQTIRERAAARGTTNTLTLLLSLRSGPDDAAADWHTIGIQTYPREKFGTLSDRDASVKFSHSVAGNAKEVGQPSDITIGDFHFVVSSFELREGQLTKRARIYTTVRKGMMLSLSFSANSSDTLDGIVSSMKTFTPLEIK